ncbi:carbohydrate sulfotransferase 3-like [Glandiceps talaboti]
MALVCAHLAAIVVYIVLYFEFNGNGHTVILQEKKQIPVGIVNSKLYSTDLGLEAYKPTLAARTNILIVAGARTGSSFVGELFNSNPEIFYLFEPLQKLSEFALKPAISLHGVNILSQIYGCKFEKTRYMDEYFKGLYRESDLPRNQTHSRSCQTSGIKRAEQCCHNRTIIATKIIRLLDVRDFIPLISDKEVRLKLIYIARDPRSMMVSLMAISQASWNPVAKTQRIQRLADLNEPLLDRLKQYCDLGLRNYLLFKASTSYRTYDWTDSYLVLRFEDIALNTTKYAQVMYDFAELKLHENVEQWIETNVNSKNRWGVYSTERNSSAVVNQWRSKMTFELVKRIQNAGVCGEYMRVLHYNKVNSVIDLKNVNFVLLDPL